LIGGLLVGALTAKAIAMVHRLHLIAVNHLEAHALTVGLTEGLEPPYLLLLVSGGHTQLLLVNGVGRYRRLGSTIDDALGEAFDKAAKLLGLGFPGGPAVELAALAGRPGRFALPRPMLGRQEAHFSFAGLKTALRQQALARLPLQAQDVADLCAEFQAAVADSVSDRVERAIALMAEASGPGIYHHLVVAGGVAANRSLSAALARTAAAAGISLHVPPAQLCGDNAAMVAWAGAERLARGLTDGLDFAVRARWPLDPDAPPALGAGKRSVGTTSSVSMRPPSRKTRTLTRLPILLPSSTRAMSSMPVTVSRSSARMTSPGSRPAACAGLPGCTSTTRTPASWLRPACTRKRCGRLT
jgi:N6-L-threonylcarbamoyladenine synthase